MMWLWAGALGGTLVGFFVVLRALARTDAAAASLRAVVEAVEPVPEAGLALDRATVEVARRRAALGHRCPPTR